MSMSIYVQFLHKIQQLYFRGFFPFIVSYDGDLAKNRAICECVQCASYNIFAIIFSLGTRCPGSD